MKTLKYLLAFAALYLLAVCTKFGQVAEDSLIVGYGNDARISTILYSAGPPPLIHEWATLVLGLGAIGIVTLARRRWLDGAAALCVVAGTLGTTEVLNLLLPRPDLSGAGEVESSFPSGHVAITAGITLGLVLISSPRTRNYVAAVGTVWLAVIAAAVQTLYWHRPSDALGATLLACAFYTLATQLLKAIQPLRTVEPATRLSAVPVLAIATVAAVVASSRSDAYARPLVFAGVGLVCGLLVTGGRRFPGGGARSRSWWGKPGRRATGDPAGPPPPPQRLPPATTR